jgi:beta-lactamase class C
MRTIARSATLAALALSLVVRPLPASADAQTATAAAVRGTIVPLMRRYRIPGLAVGVVVDGRVRVYDFGVASKATNAPVTPTTLFEIGSLSKTFTATLASYAAVTRRLSLDDDASADLAWLRGSAFDRITLRELGTHTAGGLPLQFPATVTTDAQARAYLRAWRPTYAPGTYRLYANPSIALLGVITAARLHGDFAASMRRDVFGPLGLHDSLYAVPANRMRTYAQGYARTDTPIRMAPGPLAAEAYGIRTTAGDMARFLQANMGLVATDAPLRRALAATHTAYDRIGPMRQDLIWEQYPFPVSLATLLAGNGAHIAFDPIPARAIVPPTPPAANVYINKTGSTNGFGAYAAFVPSRKIGVVLLANKNYPIAARVRAAYAILRTL